EGAGSVALNAGAGDFVRGAILEEQNAFIGSLSGGGEDRGASVDGDGLRVTAAAASAVVGAGHVEGDAASGDVSAAGDAERRSSGENIETGAEINVCRAGDADSAAIHAGRKRHVRAVAVRQFGR